MKYLSLLIFFFFLSSSYSQEYSFQLYSQYCDSIVELEYNYVMKEVETGDYYFPEWTADSSYNFSAKPIILPSGGKFQVSSDWLDFKDIVIVIDKPGLTKYTIHVPKIAEHEGGVDLPPYYICCGKSCNGYNEDYYDNGQLRIKGVFKKGYAIELSEYYPNGMKKLKMDYRNGYFYSKSYDSMGNLIYEDRCRTLQYAFYRDYRYAKYFPNEKLHVKWEIKDHFTTIQEYYSSGKPKIIQTKTKRKEYYENGKIKTAYKWKKIKEDNSFDQEKKLFSIYKITYDNKGHFINKEESTESISYDPQPLIAYTKNYSD